MSNRVRAASTLPWYRQAPKVLATVASTGAACVSVLTFLYSFGVIGDANAVNGVGSFGVTWVGLRPAADTARAIGDTLHLAATITDKSGAVVLNTRPAWSSEDPAIASVQSDGSVIARGPGATTVTVAVGSIVARSRIVVRQRVATVEVAGPVAGTNAVLSEGERRALQAHARDARGALVARQHVTWSSEDSTVAAVDSTGGVTGEMPGRTRLGATIAGVTGYLPVHVVAAPATVALAAGDSQRAEAGQALPQPVVVRVMSRRGVPIAGVPVRFHSAEGGARVDPAATMTDPEGRARTSWTLAGRPGRQRLLATADGVDSALVLTAEADPSAANTRVSIAGEAPTGVAGHALEEPVAVHVADSTGRLLGDLPVSWVALDGEVTPLAARTDSLGIARASWQLGRKAGVQRLQVLVGSTRSASPVPPVVIRATAASGTARHVRIASGDAQRGTVGVTLRRPVVLRALDSLGNAVPNVSLLVAGLGATGDSTLRTDSAGQATIAWTLGATAGRQLLLARIAGLRDSVIVSAEARPATSAPARQAGTPRRSTKSGARGGG